MHPYVAAALVVLILVIVTGYIVLDSPETDADRACAATDAELEDKGQ